MDTVSEDERLAQRTRKLDPEQYATLCGMHLSFLLDLTSEELLAICGNKSRCSGNGKQPFSASLQRKFKVGPSTVLLTQAEMISLNKLIEFLGHSQNICQEGLFRKSGKKSRQRHLRHLLATGVPLQLEESSYNVHDCANALKGFLADFPEPLLTESHFFAHCQIASLYKDSFEPSQKELIRGRQIEALRLLFLLLPNKSRNLLRNLLMLLHKVSLEKNHNKMNALNLATMFAPHMLCPRKLSADEFYQKSSVMTQAVTLMIEYAPELFKLPTPLAADLRTFWENKKSLRQQNKNSVGTFFQAGSFDSSAVQTSVTFCDRQKSDTDCNFTTAAALAELYSHIHSMPDSAKKQQLIKQIHKDSSIESPLNPHHKRSRSLRKSVKRQIFGTHKRHRTSQFYTSRDVASKDNSSSVILTRCSTSTTEYKHSGQEEASNHSENNRPTSPLRNELETIKHPAYCQNQKFEKPPLCASSSISSVRKMVRRRVLEEIP